MERVEGYAVVYRQAEDVILAEVPAIPGCFSDGRTLEEARERVRDAILNFLEDFEESGEDIPPDVLLLKSLNRAYDDSPSADEREQMQSMRQKQWEQMKGEW